MGSLGFTLIIITNFYINFNTMTPKQELSSIKKKMQRIKDNNPDFVYFEEACRRFHDIQRYYELKQKHFFIEFELEHCKTCGKKI
jgi:hypothetical protein